jgi:hypothetical protein
MLLKCTECGYENQLGAIFCRDCGAKLDVEKMRPEVKDHKPKGSIIEMVKNIFAIALLLGIAFVFGSMFYPESAPADELSDQEIVKTDAKFQALINKIAGEPEESTYVFSPEEVTYLYNKKLVESLEGGGYAIKKLHFSIDSYDNVVLLADATMFGGVSVSFKLVGALEDEKANMRIISAKMGHFSIPGFLQDKVIAKFTPGIDGGSIKDIIDATEKLVIEDGNFNITVKELTKK